MTTASPPAEATNAELIRWSFDALNRRDLDALEQFWDENTVERLSRPDVPRRRRDRRLLPDALDSLPDWHMEIKSIAEDGDDVFVQWHLTGTQSGPLLGIAPTGKPVSIDGIDHFVLRDGRVVSNFVVFDQMQYARQIGMMPPDGSAGDKAFKAAFNARQKIAAKLKR